MLNRRIRLYIIYALPALGLLGLLYTGFAPIRLQSPFTQLLPKLFFIAYLLLNFKDMNRRLNPGLRMMEALKKEEVVRKVAVRKSWQRAGLILRLVFFLAFTTWALVWLFVRERQDYGWIGILIMLAAFMAVGVVEYFKNPPQQILVTQKGIHSYIWTYLFIPWEKISHFTQKMEWLSIRQLGKSDHDINYDELDDTPFKLIYAIKPIAESHNIPWKDLSEEYNPAV